MSLPFLAEPSPDHDSPVTATPAGRKKSIFENDALVVIGRIKQALTGLLATLGVRKPGELQKVLSLDATLSYQIFRVVGERSVLAAGSSVPSRISIERFVKSAAQHGATQAMLDAVTCAYDSFEQLVERHAGDRTSFNSLITGAAGLSDEWLTADLQHRRNVFRGMSHVMGVQAKSRIVSNFLMPADGDRFNFAYVAGYVGFRFLRDLDRVKVHGIHMQNKAGDGPPPRKPLSLSSDASGYLLNDYSTSPAPRFAIERGEENEHSWTQTSLIEPEIGNIGVTNVFFGEKVRMEPAAAKEHQFSQLVSVPVEAVIQDVIVYPGTIEGTPKLRVFLGSDTTNHRAPDTQDVHGNHQIEFLGKGADVLAIPDLPNYPELARSIAAELGYDIGQFDVWRVRLEFPVYQSSSRISWER